MDYSQKKCPYCGQAFTEEAGIVVCPDCGAPHHRACWDAFGKCAYDAQHGTGRTEPASAPTEASAETVICPFCRAENESGVSFCTHCGAPITQHGAPFRVFLDPLGGVSPEEAIESATAEELAEAVGQNSTYYLPLFRELANGKRKFAPNLSVMLFSVPWFFYRKMILPGIGMLILQAALRFPSIWGALQILQYGENVTFPASFSTLYMICSVLQFAADLIMAFFANRIYLHHCVALVQKHRDEPKSERLTAIRKKGGVVRAIPIIWGILVGLYLLVQTGI